MDIFLATYWQNVDLMYSQPEGHLYRHLVILVWCCLIMAAKAAKAANPEEARP